MNQRMAKEICLTAVNDPKMDKCYMPVIMRGLEGGKVRLARDCCIYMAIHSANKVMDEAARDAISAEAIGIAADMILDHYRS